MIAADSSSLSAFFKGEKGTDIQLLTTAFNAGDICLPPIVLTELMSDPASVQAMTETVAGFALLPILEGYWQRAGEIRRRLHQKGLKAKTADALIAQACIDHDVALITRDTDFRRFAKHCGLKLA
jgi:predicted nucleic acid-binding protein